MGLDSYHLIADYRVNPQQKFVVNVVTEGDTAGPGLYAGMALEAFAGADAAAGDWSRSMHRRETVRRDRQTPARRVTTPQTRRPLHNGSNRGPSFGNRMMKWLVVLIGILYALLPMDLLPDLVAGLGWLDDLLLAGMIWYWFFRRPGRSRSRGASPEERDTEDAGARARRAASGEAPGDASTPPDDPYRVLELEPGASPDDIRSAYRRLAARYHPDKVAHLGDEFQRLAEQKFKAIQAAYDQLQPRS